MRTNANVDDERENRNFITEHCNERVPGTQYCKDKDGFESAEEDAKNTRPSRLMLEGSVYQVTRTVTVVA
jgi:hypothetical protein